jgi:hypothetical protein
LRNDIIRAIQALEPLVSSRIPKASLPSIAGYNADELRAVEGKSSKITEARRPPHTSPSQFDGANVGGRAGSLGQSEDEKDSNPRTIRNGPLIVSTLIVGSE